MANEKNYFELEEIFVQIIGSSTLFRKNFPDWNLQLQQKVDWCSSNISPPLHPTKSILLRWLIACKQVPKAKMINYFKAPQFGIKIFWKIVKDEKSCQLLPQISSIDSMNRKTPNIHVFPTHRGWFWPDIKFPIKIVIKIWKKKLKTVQIENAKELISKKCSQDTLKVGRNRREYGE